MKKKFLASLVTVITALWMVGTVNATPVDLELLLAVDVSGSIDDNEFALQKQGYVDAFRDTDIINSIMNGGVYQSIAVSLMYWSSSNQQVQAVDWMQISDSTSSNDFADAVNGASRPYSNSTAIGSALAFGAPLFTNSFEGERLVLDLSGDGTNNDGISEATGRQAVIDAGVDAINALAIEDQSLVSYFNANVIYNGQTWFASSFDTFGAAVKTKIGAEINNPVVPEPGTIALFGIGLAGLLGTGLRRKKRA